MPTAPPTARRGQSPSGTRRRGLRLLHPPQVLTADRVAVLPAASQPAECQNDAGGATAYDPAGNRTQHAAPDDRVAGLIAGIQHGGADGADHEASGRSDQGIPRKHTLLASGWGRRPKTDQDSRRAASQRFTLALGRSREPTPSSTSAPEASKGTARPASEGSGGRTSTMMSCAALL